MNHQKRKKLWLKCVGPLALFALLVLVSSCGCNPPDPPDPTKGTIYVKGLFDLSGATKDVGVSYHKGVLDSIREANDTGGVLKYKLDFDWKDYAYQKNQAVDIYKGWKKEDSWGKIVTIFGWGTGDSVILSPKVAEDKKPYISASYAGSLASPVPVKKTVSLPDGSDHQVDTPGAPYNFFAGTDYSTSIRLAMEYVKLQGGKKVIFAFCSAGYCTDPIPAGKNYAKELGLEILPDLGVELGDTLGEIEKKTKKYFTDNPDSKSEDVWVWLGNTIKTAVYTTQAIALYGHDSTKMIANIWGFDETAPTRCKEDWKGSKDPCVDRLHGVLSFAAFGDMTYRGMKKVVNLHKKWRDHDKESLDKYADVRYVQGYVSFFVWRQAVEKIINEEKEITSQNIKATLETFRELSTDGLTLPLSFSKDDHRPNAGSLIYTVGSDGKLKFKKEVQITLKKEWKGW